MGENRQIILIGLIFAVLVFVCLLAAWLLISGLDQLRAPSATPTPVADASGLLITAVAADSPAAFANLQPGHIIVAVNDIPTNDVATLSSIVSNVPAWGELLIVVEVDGELRQTTAVRNTEPPLLGVEVVPNGGANPAHLLPTLPPEATAPPTELPPGSLVVARILPASPAEEIGLRIGDVITAVDGEAIFATGELINLLSIKSPGDAMTLTYRRGDETQTTTLTLIANPNDPERAYLGIELRP